VKLTPWMLTVATFLIIAALAAGFLFKKLFASEEQPAVVDPLRQVPMATSNVEAGTRIVRNHLGQGPWNRNDLTADTILSLESLVGRIAKDDIPAATPLRASMFYPIGQGPELDLAPGMRAVSFNVGDTTEMVNGLIHPGDYVDDRRH